MKKAYTLFEVLIAFALLSLMLAILIPFGASEISQTNVNSSAKDLSSQIFTQQVKAYSSIGDSSHGIYFGTNSYTLFEGESLLLSTNQEEVFLPSNTSISNISLNIASREVIFLKNSVLPTNYGFIDLQFGNQVARININSEGRIYVEKV